MPTWFWADSYDGRVLGRTVELRLPWQECRDVEHDEEVTETVELPDGLNPDGSLRVRQEEQTRVERRSREECRAMTDVVRVGVALEPARFTWSFGDGQPVEGSLGHPYPVESDVRHTWQQSSVAYLQEGGYPITLSAEWSAGYSVSVNGALVDVGGLPPRFRTYEARHQVRQIQAVLGR